MQCFHGFLSREMIDIFVRCATSCFERYKNKVKYWLTFNEINGIIFAPKIGPLYGRGIVYEGGRQRTETCILNALRAGGKWHGT